MITRIACILGLMTGGFAAAQDKAAFASFIELPWRYVIGGHADGKWLKSEAAGKKLSAATTPYRVFTIDGEAGTVTGSAASPDADVCPDVWMLKISPEPDLQSPSIGVHAPWNPQPRKPRKSSTTQEVYLKAVGELLAGKGVMRADVKITQLLRVDLDGDGVDEVLLSATRYVHKDELMTAESGDYSFVAIRRVVKGDVQTQIISGEFYPKKLEDAAPSIHELSGVLDLDGDGVLEVLVNSAYYEGGGLKVFQLQKDKLVEVLAIDCGV